MNFRAIKQHRWTKPALASVLTALCGLLLYTKLGDRWVESSYDYLFRFAARSITNQLVLVMMDNEAYDRLGQKRGKWDRLIHAEFLERLAAEGCPLVVVDIFFGEPGQSNVDTTLARAISKLSKAVLMARPIGLEYQPGANVPGTGGARWLLPFDAILQAAKTNWGLAVVDPGPVVRAHLLPASPNEPTLAWAAATLAGATFPDIPKKRWLRYYAPKSWTTISYAFAKEQPPGYFHDKIVFIGNQPENPQADVPENDKFQTPYTLWTRRAVGGVEIHATQFLNLLNKDSLERPATWIEMGTFALVGVALGMASTSSRKSARWGIPAAIAFVALVGGVVLAHYTNYWFPWLIVSGGQAPCALALAVALRDRTPVPTRTIVIHQSTPAAGPAPSGLVGSIDAPDYELVHPPFGEGAYGLVWLARNAVGQWQAVKAVYRARFGDDPEPYQREFRGIERYKRVSDQHPGLLRIDFVSRMKKEGYFYYAMELGDSAIANWQTNPGAYRPLDLAALRDAAPQRRLPISECLRIGLKLSEALQFLHSQDLTHRDIKPGNVIFVNGQPKLADVGLVGDARRPEKELTWVGTPGYMPAEPEPPGTPQADIFGLGMVLYVISTGLKPTLFPDLSSTLIDRKESPEFAALHPIIFKACHPDRQHRYTSAAELHAALMAISAR